MVQAQTQTHCTHHHSLNTNIHKFVFHVADEEGVNDFFRQLDVAFNEHPQGETMLLLTDLRPDGIPPFNYALSMARRFFANRETPNMRAVYIYDKNPFLTIIRTFFGMLPLKTQRRFMQGGPDSNVEHEATAWLLSDERP